MASGKVHACAAATCIAACVCSGVLAVAADPTGQGGRDFLFGNAFLHEEGITRTIWKGGESLSRTHCLPGRRLLSAKVSIHVYNYKKGAVETAASTNGVDWVVLGQARRKGLIRWEVPAELLPCSELHFRATAVQPSSLRFAHYQLVATVDGEPGFLAPPRDPVSSNRFFRADFGELLPADDPELRVWRAESGWRVSRRRVAPEAKAGAVEIQVAANEAEAAQLVITPRKALADARVALVGDLVAADGARLGADAVDILRVGYVPVRQRTDGSCVAADHPDPLPPQDGDPWPVPAGENQPFWVRVRPPKGTRPGVYRGGLEISADGVRKRVPLSVEVFGFALPDETTCRSQLGLNLDFIEKYQRLASAEEKRVVFDKYLRFFADNRISPYRPAPNAQWTVRWEGDAPRFDWAEWDAAMAHAMDSYRFNAFRMSLDGLGSGDSQSHRRRAIGGVGEDDPRYAVRMKAYLGGIEAHLREKGWLDKAAVYWFDEPDVKDYPFVRSGFDILRKYAPGLARAITEEPVEGLAGAPDIWCSHTHRLYDHPAALAAARARGDRIWWYLCWLPKAPYAGLFIDHPAVEMRTWLWQSRAERVTGVLVWLVNRWQSTSLYKNGALQNPYLDPMSRHSGDGKSFGNGDGMLVYPPKERISGPVTSIRMEMLRDGLEDYEYFAILEKKDPSSPLLVVPKDVSESLTKFSDSPIPIMRHRLRLARAIEGGVGSVP